MATLIKNIEPRLDSIPLWMQFSLSAVDLNQSGVHIGSAQYIKWGFNLKK